MGLAAMRKPKAKNAKCDQCPLYEGTLVPSYAPKDWSKIRLIVVGEGPGHREAFFGKPFVGGAGDVIRNLLKEFGFNPETEVVWTNAALCLPNKVDNKSEALAVAITACRGRLESFLDYVNARVPSSIPILALGQFAQQALEIGQDRWERESLRGRWSIGSHHPSAILRDPTKYVYLEQAVKKLSEPRVVFALSPEYVVGFPDWNSLEVAQYICVDIETSAPTKDQAVRWFDPEQHILDVGVAIPAGPDPRFDGTKTYILPPNQQAWLRALFTQYHKKIVGHNIKFDVLTLHDKAETPVQVGHDTMVMANILAPDWHKGLKDLVAYYFDAPDYEAEIKKHLSHLPSKKQTYDKIPRADLREYLSNDVHWNLLLTYELEDRLTLAGRISAPYTKFEVPLLNLLSKVEARGFCVDRNRIANEEQEFEKDLAPIRELIQTMTNGEIENPNSFVQAARYFYDNRGWNHSVRGYDKRSTAAPVLDNLIDQGHEAPAAVKLYRRIAKLRSSYLSNLWRLMRQCDDGYWRVHPSYKQAHVKTGRLSAVKPAIQTIPRKDEDRDAVAPWIGDWLRQHHPGALERMGDYGHRIKKCYTATPGNVLVSVDGSQWEVAVAAIWSRDPYLLKALQEGKSIHSAMCDVAFGEGNWTQEQRSEMKRVDFSLFYGGSIESSVAVSRFTRAEKQRVVDMFYDKLVVFAEYRKELERQAREEGQIISPHFNRVFPFRFICSTNDRNIRKWAVNYPIQGTASNITMEAAVLAWPHLIKRCDAPIVACVHDSIIVDSPPNQVDNVIRILSSRFAMAGKSFSDLIPWDTEAEVGYRWGDLKGV